MTKELTKNFNINALQLKKGDLFKVEEGEVLPADGLVSEGKGNVDESSLTGEPIPVSKKPGNRVKSGSRVIQGTFKVRAEGVGDDSILGQMITLIQIKNNFFMLKQIPQHRSKYIKIKFYNHIKFTKQILSDHNFMKKYSQKQVLCKRSYKKVKISLDFLKEVHYHIMSMNINFIMVNNETNLQVCVFSKSFK